MTLPTLHLVYMVPDQQASKGRLARHFTRLLQRSALFDPVYRSADPSRILWPSPIHAPFSITYNLILALRLHYKIKLYDWSERCRIKLHDEDLFLFHPRPDFNSDRAGDTLWSRCDPGNICTRTLEYNDRGRRVLIMPYTHDDHAGWLNPILDRSSSELIAICGRFWTDSWDRSAYASKIARLLQVNMAIDATRYPMLKQSFNPPGRRKFLYIGHTSPYKNTIELERIAASYPGFIGGHIGHGRIAGWNKIANQVALTPKYMQQLASEFDIFVNVSRADAQATTIIEQICFGLAIACTPESGYQLPSITELSCTNTKLNVEKLLQLQEVSEKELLDRAVTNRKVVEQDHTWQQFCDRIVNFLCYP